MNNLVFGRGGAVKAKVATPAPAAAAVAGAGAGGQVFNGTVNGKRGFQKGNQFGGKGHRNQHVAGLKKAHTAKAAIARRHAQKGTLLSSAGRAAIKDAAAAHRELQAARAEHQVNRQEARNAARRVGAKTPAPAPPAPEPARPTKTPVEHRVAASAREAGVALADHAAKKLGDLKAGAGAGTHDGDAIGTHVDRIARGATKEQLFAATKSIGIDHGGVTTKKALVDALKNKLYDHSVAAKAARTPEPTAKAATAPTPKPSKAPANPGPTRGGTSGGTKAGGVGASAPGRSTPERAEKAQILRSARAVPDDANGLKPVHAIRDHAEGALGRPIPVATFDRTIGALHAKGSHELLNLNDSRNLTPRQRERSIPTGFGGRGGGQVGAFLIRNRKQDFSR